MRLPGTLENVVNFFFFLNTFSPQKYWREMGTDWAARISCDLGGPKECPTSAALKS